MRGSSERAATDRTRIGNCARVERFLDNASSWASQTRPSCPDLLIRALAEGNLAVITITLRRLTRPGSLEGSRGNSPGSWKYRLGSQTLASRVRLRGWAAFVELYRTVQI